MLPDPKAELTREWLLVASEDLRLAELAKSADPPLLSGVVYHCQQAFEKALKAFLVWHGRPIQRTHALPELVALCQQIDLAFSSPGGGCRASHSIRCRLPVPADRGAAKRVGCHGSAGPDPSGGHVRPGSPTGRRPAVTPRGLLAIRAVIKKW
ncbi:MAG: HEPN domain-containing protein [Chloroflexi bacterium]|nr:HEPN domain-containing protein [Chloroflexota bacterium]